MLLKLLSLSLIALSSPILAMGIVWKVFPGEIYDKKHILYNMMRGLLLILITVLLTWTCLYLNNFYLS